MVTRSLVTKVYAYAVGVFIVMFLVAFGVARLLIDQSQVDAFTRIGVDQARYIGEEVEATYQEGRPSSARLTRLAEALHAELHVVPWTDRTSYPEALQQQEVVAEKTRRIRQSRAYWVRLDVNGVPQAALHVRYRGYSERPSYTPALAAAIWMAMLAMMIVPPLYFLVLRPLRKMVAVANRLGEGDLNTPVPIDRKDEFGELERAFESLRVRIQLMLEQKQRLLTDISHELRGPLSRLSIALPLARESGEAHYFDDMKREFRAMNELIGELLAYARGQAPMGATIEEVDLAELSREIIEERSLSLEVKNIRVHRELGAAGMRGDKRLLMRAMGNLLDNAIKYVPEASSINIKTGIEGDEAVFRIEDDGPGIAAHHLPNLFEPFYRPDDSRSRETGGVGLGLSIVKAIVDGHGGEVALSSVEGAGTSVVLRFPVGPSFEMAQ